MSMRGLFCGFKFHNKSDSDLVVRPKAQKPKVKGSRLGRFGLGLSRSEITSEAGSDAGLSSSARAVQPQQPGEPARQLTDVSAVSCQPVAGTSNATIVTGASSLIHNKESTVKEETSLNNAGPYTDAAPHPIAQGGPITVPCDTNATSNTPSASSALSTPDASTLNANPGRQEPNIDASVRVSHQGVTYNIGPNAVVTLLYGSQINQHDGKHRLDAAIRGLRRSHNAEFNMTANTNRGPCTSDTRTTILEDLVDWCNSDTISLYWMNGMAGTGKTTIAYSLCELLAKANILGASFFCSRSLPDCRNSNIIIPTIAFQLAKKYAPFAKALAKVLENDEDILNRGLDVQLHELLIKPWNENISELPSHAVIIVDAVDECDERHSDFLKAISNHTGRLPFKFMVTSRPEPAVRSVLLAKDPETLTTFILHEVEASLVEEDITRYVESELKKCLPSLSSSDARQLSKQCEKFFIYAATLCRFIMDEDGNHLERFRLLLSLSPSDVRGKAIQPIDALYIAILERAFSSNKPRSEIDGIKLVFHLIVCAREPLTRDAIANLLQLSTEEVEFRLKSLRSLIFIPASIRQPLSTFHASLPDFMLDDSRSGEFCCHPHASNLEILKQCLVLMKRELRRNICHLDGRPPNNTIDSNIIDANISLGLRYAGIYWLEHWMLSDDSGCRTTERLLNDFFITDALHWFECLCLTGKLSIAIESLEGLHDTLDENIKLANVAHEYLRFIQYAYEAIEHNAMEMYFSALAWIPSFSSLRTAWSSLFKQAPRVPYGLPATWAGPDQIINVRSQYPDSGHINSIVISRDGRYIIFETHYGTMHIWNVRFHIEERDISGYTDEVSFSTVYRMEGQFFTPIRNVEARRPWFNLDSGSPVSAVILSPDTEWIASGHDDYLIRIWDTTDDHLVYSFQGHKDHIRSLSFTPNSSHLVSGSEDNTARIWNMTTKQTESILQGHTGCVLSIAYSPNCDKIITGSHDNNARLWDTSGKGLHVLRGHSSDVGCVAFMPDGKRVITGSNDKTLRVWDVGSGDMVRLLTGLMDVAQSVAGFPDGLKFASSSGKTISIWSLRGGTNIGEEEENDEPTLPNVEASSMAFSANGRRVLLLPSLRILDTATLEEKVVLEPDGVRYHRGALSTSGNRVAVSADFYVIKVWELTGDDIVTNHFTLQSYPRFINHISFSHDERQLISTSTDDNVQIWDVTTGNQVHALQHRSMAYSPKFSHDGTQIVSHALTYLYIWDAQSGRLLREFYAYGHPIAFSSDDRHIITSEDNTVRIYNAETFQLEHTHKGYKRWTTMNDGSSYALSEDNHWIYHSRHFGDQPRRLLWIPLQYQPTVHTNYSPIFTLSSAGVQVCLPRANGLVTLVIPHDD